MYVVFLKEHVVVSGSGRSLQDHENEMTDFRWAGYAMCTTEHN